MCTCISYQTNHHYFGRNLDLDYSYEESVTVTPRHFPFVFRNGKTIGQHPALIGMAYVCDSVPLYYDAANEAGLAMAGLNFPGNAVYQPPGGAAMTRTEAARPILSDEQTSADGIAEVAPFEFIPWVLARCASLAEARRLLARTRLVDEPYSAGLPNAQLHWMIADRTGAIVVEPLADGLRVTDDPVGVLTNNPPFEWQIMNLNNYRHLSPYDRESTFAEGLGLEAYSRGMGGIGLPGDLSSASRFVRAAFAKMNAVCDGTVEGSVSQFFHLLGAVEQTRGCARLDGGRYEITIYSSCCDTDAGVYYYRTYENSAISAVDMHREELGGDALRSWPIAAPQHVIRRN